MNAAMDAAGQLLILLGAMLTLLAGIGVVRFGDALARMHALTKASTLGVVLVRVCAGVVLDNVNYRTSPPLAALTQRPPAPVGANLIGPTTYAAAGIPTVLSGPDELAEDHRPGA